MGGILDHRDAPRVAGRHDRVHVRGVAAHVADEDGGDTVVELGAEIVKVDAHGLAHLDQNRNAVGMDHRRGDGGEGEGRDQDARALRQVQRLQREEERGRTGRDGKRVAAAEEGREFGFEPGHRGAFGGGVSEQVARLQEPFYFRKGGGGDGFCLIDVGGFGRVERQSVRGHSFAFLKLPISDFLTRWRCKRPQAARGGP